MEESLRLSLRRLTYFPNIPARLQEAATQRFPPSTQAFILEVRKARDAAMSDLEKVKKERDQLRERLRVGTAGLGV